MGPHLGPWTWAAPPVPVLSPEQRPALSRASLPVQPTSRPESSAPLLFSLFRHLKVNRGLQLLKGAGFTLTV